MTYFGKPWPGWGWAWPEPGKIIDDDDLSWLLAHWNWGCPPPMGEANIPEPATVALFGLSGASRCFDGAQHR